MRPFNILAGHAIDCSCRINNSVNVVASDIDLHSTAFTYPGFKDPCLNADTEDAGDGLHDPVEERHHFTGPGIMFADPAKKVDAVSTNIKHLLDLRNAILPILFEVRGRFVVDIPAQLLLFFHRVAWWWNQNIKNQVSVALRQVFCTG